MFSKKKKSKKIRYELCSICKSPMKDSIRDRYRLPYGVRVGKYCVCTNCLEELNYENNLIIEGYRVEKEENFKSTNNNAQQMLKQKIESLAVNEEQELAEEEEIRIQFEGDTKNKKSAEQINFNDMLDSIKKVVKGQDKQVEKLCTTIIRNSCDIGFGNEKRKNHIIIVGDSGVGKTLMLDELAKATNKVCSYEDATSYTEEGYVGDSVNDMLVNLLQKSDDDLQLAQEGIIVIDEGDKKAGVKGNGRDVSGNQVLFGMLKMLDGATIPVTKNRRSVLENTKIMFNTSKLTFVFIGVFPGIEDSLKKRLENKVSIGFATKEETKATYTAKEIIPSDFIPLGFPKEFIARFSVVIKMNPMTKEIVYDILNSKFSYLQLEIERMKSYNVKIEISQEVIDEIAEATINQSIGARGIESIVNYIFENIWNDILRQRKIKKVKLLDGITMDNTKYKLF